MSKFIVSINDFFADTEPLTIFIIAQDKTDAYLQATKMYIEHLDNQGIDFDDDNPTQDFQFQVSIYNLDELTENKVIKYLYDV